jgi:hypothetical protein
MIPLRRVLGSIHALRAIKTPYKINATYNGIIGFLLVQKPKNINPTIKIPQIKNPTKDIQ